MQTTLHSWGNWTIVAVEGEFVVRYLNRIRPTLDELAQKSGLNVALDLRATTLVDSTAVSTIVNFHKRLQQAGGRVVILQPSPNIKEVFSITGVGVGIRLYDKRGSFEKEVSEGKL